MVILITLDRVFLDEFDLDTYEYHELKGSVPKGFVFGLFSMREASVQDLKDALL